MSGAVAQQDKVSGWIESLEGLRQVLNEGHAVANEIIGPVPEEQAVTEKPGCLTDRVADELSAAILSATQLVGQLERIRGQF